MSPRFAFCLLVVAGSLGCANRAVGLDRLRSELTEVKDAPVEALPIDRGRDVDPGILVGMTVDDVRAALGVGQPCRSHFAERYLVLEPGETQCEPFDFHRLPAGSAGGGTLLTPVLRRNGSLSARALVDLDVGDAPR